jgi:stage II sporulation protein GA (sporulation sigma-E factor processing peptidase)
VTVGYQGKTVTVRALRDTGNQLKDPLTGKCVSILSARTAEPFLEAGAKLYYIPFRTIGKENGLLPGFVADYMKIGQEQEYRQIERPVIALSPEPVNREGRYEMILPHLFFNE